MIKPTNDPGWYGAQEPGGANSGDFAILTPREMETLEHLAQGRLRKEIAACMSIRQGTVDQFVKHIYDKLGVRSKTAAAIKYWRTRLAPPRDQRRERSSG